MYTESELLPLSGLQHLAFCERQWALIHLEHQWAENRLTAEGRILHEAAHEGRGETRPGIVIARGLQIRSFRLGLIGQADVVEYELLPDASRCGVHLDGRDGWWRPFPIEYNRGRPKVDLCDEVQLCAQAICLEEMHETDIMDGALFYARNRRRTLVAFDAELRTRVEEIAAQMHQLYAERRTPSAMYGKKCEKCSLTDLCLPAALSEHTPVARYLERALVNTQETD
jgi:CRISPR-associated exonuclease Cas4